MTIQFKSRFLRPADAVLCLVARNIGGTLGMTLVFDLKTTIESVTHSEVIKSESPCYEMQNINLKVFTRRTPDKKKYKNI